MEKLITVINQDLKQAMIGKKELELSVLRMLISALKNKQIELKNREDMSDEQVIEVVKSEVKKRKDSIEAYKAGDRNDLVEKEEAEIKILEKYMPEQMSEAEVEKIVAEVVAGMENPSPAVFGQVMGQVMAKVKGQADGAVVSTAVKKILNK